MSSPVSRGEDRGETPQIAEEIGESTSEFEEIERLESGDEALPNFAFPYLRGFVSLKIYGTCPYCDLRYSNFHHLNKHSCYNKLARKACRQSYCQYCKEEFVSHKRFIFHLQFHLTERRSKVCLICNKDFTDVNEFFVHVNYEHDPPEKLACKICDRIFTDTETFGAHQKSHETEPKYKCDECSKSYHIKRLLLKHKEDFHTNIEYKCDLCPKIFPTLPIYENHLKWHDTDAEVHVYICSNCGLIGSDKENLEKHTSDSCSECFDCEIEEEILIAAYRCHFCAQDFKNKDSLRNHRATGLHDNGKFCCPVCNEELDNLKAKRIHMISVHKNQKSSLESLPLKRLLMCDVGECEECYTQWPALQRHKNRLHKPNTCPKCNQKLKNCNELKNHIEHCRPSEFICQFCDKVCPTKMSLAVHVGRRHNNKNIFCPHCSCAYKNEKALQDHIDYSHVPVPCTHCEKVINCKRYLETHMRVVHESECRYYCEHCNKGFFHRSQKELHEVNFHPDSVYKCGECNFTTKNAKSLEIHIAIHLKKSEFKCPYCPKIYGRKNALSSHIKRHKDERPFRCSDTIVDGCDATFIESYLLNRHIANKHSLRPQKTNENSAKSKRKKNALYQRKLGRKNKREAQAYQPAMRTGAIKCENATQMNDVLFETNVASFPGVGVSDEKVFINMDGLQNTTSGEDYMLLVVDDGAMPLVNSTNGQLYVLDDTEITTS
ncbi:PREDICTED: zinc finger protein 665-like [Rhagoletis zephyria]|uniref:zinc finger protein 665-like n=1 Tax=Rhagoletis zephyria TaxID=28612 RepID=UPI0008118520|nr:PREDICTED: zinc finger protein 665-like [Rhagoletis zephyria]